MSKHTDTIRQDDESLSGRHEAGRVRRLLIACCGAHVIQDGLVALQYVLLPILAQALQLNYAQVGFLRAIGHLASSVLEIPAGALADRTGASRLVVFGLICAGLGYLGVSFSSGFALLGACFLIAGVGAGFQHSLSSSIIVNGVPQDFRRKAMGIYNAAGDGGKLLYTGLFSLGVGAGLVWNWVLLWLALVAIGFGLGCWWLLIKSAVPDTAIPADRMVEAPGGIAKEGRSGNRWGILQPARFSVLALIVFLDSLVQAVVPTFLGFVMLEKGMGEGVAAFAVVIMLIGGMVGKYVCGYSAARFGDRITFLVLQLLTVPAVIALIVFAGETILILLPLIGLCVQGSSTITYGSVSDFVDTQHQSKGYALIYSVSSLASVIGPVLVGGLADGLGLDSALWWVALTALIPVLMIGVLSPRNEGKA